ncbi:MAG: hypothetical protein KIT07_05570 [Anaerolineales bacterium]|nr:hypothetical protein [Anaerolineales bacterium]
MGGYVRFFVYFVLSVSLASCSAIPANPTNTVLLTSTGTQTPVAGNLGFDTWSESFGEAGRVNVNNAFSIDTNGAVYKLYGNSILVTHPDNPGIVLFFAMLAGSPERGLEDFLAKPEMHHPPFRQMHSHKPFVVDNVAGTYSSFTTIGFLYEYPGSYVLVKLQDGREFIAYVAEPLGFQYLAEDTATPIAQHAAQPTARFTASPTGDDFTLEEQLFVELLSSIRFGPGLAREACMPAPDANYGRTTDNPIRVGGAGTDFTFFFMKAYFDSLGGPNQEALAIYSEFSDDPQLHFLSVSYPNGEEIRLYVDPSVYERPYAPNGLHCKGDFIIP